MHDSRKVFLLPSDKAPTCILATYDPDRPDNTTEFKTFEGDLKTGDMVIVTTSTRHGFTAAEVVEVAVEPTLQSDEKIEWAVCKFDTGLHASIVEGEKNFLAAAKKAELAKERAELSKTMMGDLDTDSITLIDQKPAE